MTALNNFELTDDNEKLRNPDSPEVSEASDDAVVAKTKDRSFRDRVIEEEEARWNTPQKQDEVIRNEKAELRKALDQHAAKIEEGIRSMKDPLSRMEELPQFLRSCGVDDDKVRMLEQSFPTGAEGASPMHIYMVTAIYETVNSLAIQNFFPQGSFAARTLSVFEQERRANFVADDTAYVQYLDRHGEGFYSTDEGQQLIRQKAAEEISSDTTSIAA